MLAGSALALKKAAGDFAGGVGFFDVIDGQREKVLPRFGLGAGHHRGQDRGAVHIQQHRAAGLAGNLAGFHGDVVIAPLEGFGDFVKHAHD